MCVHYLCRSSPSITVLKAAAISAVANIDLAESAMKRGAGVKDSGARPPGHGNLLDRVDSTLFILPAVYAYLGLVKAQPRGAHRTDFYRGRNSSLTARYTFIGGLSIF